MFILKLTFCKGMLKQLGSVSKEVVAQSFPKLTGNRVLLVLVIMDTFEL